MPTLLQYIQIENSKDFLNKYRVFRLFKSLYRQSAVHNCESVLDL